MDNKFLVLLQSRKFWAAVIGLLFIFLGERAGMSQEALLNSVVVVVGYILGTALDK
jgi:hypothetical protein